MRVSDRTMRATQEEPKNRAGSIPEVGKPEIHGRNGPLVAASTAGPGAVPPGSRPSQSSPRRSGAPGFVSRAVVDSVEPGASRGRRLTGTGALRATVRQL